MVEAVFSESACGSLKYAQFFGRGEYGGGLLGIILEPSDGAPSEEEIAQAKRRAEEEHRRKWERARPMGGRAQDVYGFSLGLSLGDISENIPGPIRRQVLCAYCGFSPSVPGIGEQLDRWIDGGAETLRAVLERSAAGEPVRLWYSDQPDELGGFYWLLARLDGLEQCGAVSAVKLPRWDQRDNSVVTYTAWGDVPPRGVEPLPPPGAAGLPYPAPGLRQPVEGASGGKRPPADRFERNAGRCSGGFLRQLHPPHAGPDGAGVQRVPPDRGGDRPLPAGNWRRSDPPPHPGDGGRRRAGGSHPGGGGRPCLPPHAAKTVKTHGYLL